MLQGNQASETEWPTRPPLLLFHVESPVASLCWLQGGVSVAEPHHPLPLFLPTPTSQDRVSAPPPPPPNLRTVSFISEPHQKAPLPVGSSPGLSHGALVFQTLTECPQPQAVVGSGLELSSNTDDNNNSSSHSSRSAIWPCADCLRNAPPAPPHLAQRPPYTSQGSWGSKRSVNLTGGTSWVGVEGLRDPGPERPYLPPPWSIYAEGFSPRPAISQQTPVEYVKLLPTLQRRGWGPGVRGCELEELGL